MAKSTAVTTKDQATDENQVPAYLLDNNYANDDNFDQSDVVIPKIKLLQGLSGECEQFDNAKPGNFWHTGLDLDLGDEIEFIIADRNKKYLLAKPLNDGGDILARSDDAETWDKTGRWEVKLKGVKKPVIWEIDDTNVVKSGMADWGTSNPEDEDSPPAATLFYDYLVYLPQHPEVGMAVISLARAAIRQAKRGLNDKIQTHANNGRPVQSLKFVATSIDDRSDDGDFKNWHFRSGGFVQDKEMFDKMMEHKGALSRLKIQDEAATESDEAAPADTGDGNY